MKTNITHKLGSARLGVGGWHCPCCGPRNHEAKKVIRRAVRRTLKHEVNSEVAQLSFVRPPKPYRAPVVFNIRSKEK